MIIKRQKLYSAGHVTAVASKINSYAGGEGQLTKRSSNLLLKELGNTMEHRTKSQLETIAADKEFLKRHPEIKKKLEQITNNRDNIIVELNSGEYGGSSMRHHRKHASIGESKPNVSAVGETSAFNAETFDSRFGSRRFHEIQGRRKIEDLI